MEGSRERPMLARLVLCAVSVWGRVARDVVTTQGVARGYFAPHPPHYEYLGLPYAAPTRPRFKAPAPPPRWDGIFEATHRIRCPQGGAGDENCLVINVFTPEHAAALPVLVFVHDGHSQKGWGLHKPPTRLLSQGLVIVTFNYRLGLLGFLCLKVPEAPGNAGLKDQVAALYWVQRNIAYFGGDSADVTVYGVGSGAAAVQMLLLSGLADGLLHKVILESGSVLSPTSLSHDPLALAFEAAKSLGYSNSDEPEKLLKFFNKLPLRQLSNVSLNSLPCVESNRFYTSLIDQDPIEIMKKGKIQQVPMILSFTNMDGMSIVEMNKETLQLMPEQFDMLLPNNLLIEDEQKRHRVAELVKEFYFDSITRNIAQNYAGYFHDVLFEFPIVKFGVLYALRSSQPVYMMKFMCKGVKHTFNNKIIDYVLGEQLGEGDELVADRLISLYCNFIKLGDPTPITTSLVPIIWKSVSEEFEEAPSIMKASVLQFDRTLSMTTTHRNQELTFWDHIYENFYRSY